MEEYKRFTISLPADLYEEFETFRKKLGMSRSDCIRKAMHSFMVNEENIPKSTVPVSGCITLIRSHEHIKSAEKSTELDPHEHPHEHDDDHLHDHDYKSRSIYANVQQTDELLSMDIQHHFGDIIISTMHIHLEYEKCMEIIAVSGLYDRVNMLKQNLQKLKSVLSIGFFVVDKDINL